MRAVMAIVVGFLLCASAAPVFAQERPAVSDGRAGRRLHASRRRRAQRQARAVAPTCPERMAHVPAGTFWMGDDDDRERPLHRVSLGGFCIDRTEVRVRDYRVCASVGRCDPPGESVDWPEITDGAREFYSQFCNGAEGRQDREDHPINCVDWESARAYCAWRGGRLPTEAEWEYAAGGTDGREYPWGNDPPTVARLNACDLDCLDLERLTHRRWVFGIDGEDGHPDTAPVGSFPAGASPFGLFDMAGNVWEWTADWWSEELRADPQVNPAGPVTGTERAIRGGGWVTEDPARLSARFRDGVGPGYRLTMLGFRCVLPLR